jgi:hypothetical protein
VHRERLTYIYPQRLWITYWLHWCKIYVAVQNSPFYKEWTPDGNTAIVLRKHR